jgi:hypothetical protein
VLRNLEVVGGFYYGIMFFTGRAITSQLLNFKTRQSYMWSVGIMFFTGMYPCTVNPHAKLNAGLW